MKQPASRRAHCAELLGDLSSYLDGELSPARCAAMEAHLARCPCCGLLADQLRRLVAICRVSGTTRLPAHVRSRAKSRILELLDAAPPAAAVGRRTGSRPSPSASRSPRG